MKCRAEWITDGVKIVRRNINNFRYVEDTTLVAESKEELKRLLVKVKEESEKGGLKLSIQITSIMASGPIISWQIEGGKWKQWPILPSWAPKSLQWLQPWNEKMLAPQKKSYDKPRQHIKKQRHCFAYKCLYKTTGFSNSHVWM